MANILDTRLTTLAGEPTTFGELANDGATLVVNVASKCGYTSQYEYLEALHRELSPRGFTVIGVPCNQFGAEEPGTSAEIQRFCSSRYGVSFPMTEKVKVNGKGRSTPHSSTRAMRAGMPARCAGTSRSSWWRPTGGSSAGSTPRRPRTRPGFVTRSRRCSPADRRRSSTPGGAAPSLGFGRADSSCDPYVPRPQRCVLAACLPALGACQARGLCEHVFMHLHLAGCRRQKRQRNPAPPWRTMSTYGRCASRCRRSFSTGSQFDGAQEAGPLLPIDPALRRLSRRRDAG
jgi:glutathione peroxidase-family protein